MDCCFSFGHKICSKTFRVFIMFILTIGTAIIEIIYGIRTHSQSLIADGMYSFAEGICLIGVVVVLRYSRIDQTHQKNNTFGYARLELLFGLIQEIFLLSISLGIIVDAVNHLVNPVHIYDPILMISLGGVGIGVGLLGMIMFWGYHHDHNIEEEINEKRKKDFLLWTKKHAKRKRKSPSSSSSQATVVETPLIINSAQVPEQNRNADESANTNPEKPSSDHTNVERRLCQQQYNEKQRTPSILDMYTYEHVEIQESRIYATLHALCLHSFVVLLESVIVVSSGLMIQFIPHVDPNTGKEINAWLKYMDPLLTLIMVIIIAIRAVPVIFSISRLMIESVPKGIDTQQLMNEIITRVPAVKNVHSLHVWRATAKEIYATLHLVCDEDTKLSICTDEYGPAVQEILKSYCIRYFTLQFEHTNNPIFGQASIHRCAYGVHRKRRGHTLEQQQSNPARHSFFVSNEDLKNEPSDERSAISKDQLFPLRDKI